MPPLDCDEIRSSEHTTPLRELHWLKVPERIQYWLCVLSFLCLHGLAPSYLSETLHRCGCSLPTQIRDYFNTCRTLGDRVFPVAAACAWNSLLRSQCSVYFVAGFLLSTSTSGPAAWNALSSELRDPSISLDCFRHSLKTYLYKR